MKKGFTLLELLVVIGIMGILMALGTVAFSTAQRSARDSRRQQDLKAIQNALEQYYAANKYTYPKEACISPTIYFDCSKNPDLPSYFSDKKLPEDPQEGNYKYECLCDGGGYTVTADKYEKLGIGDSAPQVSNLQ